MTPLARAAFRAVPALLRSASALHTQRGERSCSYSTVASVFDAHCVHDIRNEANLEYEPLLTLAASPPRAAVPPVTQGPKIDSDARRRGCVPRAAQTRRGARMTATCTAPAQEDEQCIERRTSPAANLIRRPQVHCPKRRGPFVPRVPRAARRRRAFSPRAPRTPIPAATLSVQCSRQKRAVGVDARGGDGARFDFHVRAPCTTV